MTKIKAVHENAMAGAFPNRSTAKDCAHCRHSRVKDSAAGWVFVCKLLYDVQNAKTCPDFKDSRQASSSVPDFLR